jgi:hypothetical protein
LWLKMGISYSKAEFDATCPTQQLASFLCVEAFAAVLLVNRCNAGIATCNTEIAARQAPGNIWELVR